MQNEIEVLYTAEQIAERVQELGRIITSDYANKDLVCVGTMEDSFIFMADLVRAIQRPVECLFIKAITDKGVEEENRYKKIFYTSVTDLANRHVLMVVGMMDSGVTVDFLSRNILLQRPSSLKIITLIDKPEGRRSPAVAEYAAFTVHGRYVVGYGLGVGGRYGNFPSLAVLKGEPSAAPDGVIALGGQTDG